MNDLERHFRENKGRLIDKWQHYFEIYDRHFARFRGTDVHVVEFGVSQGGSLEMWKSYFGPAARLFGIDINPHCQRFQEEQVEIIIGDQQDRKFLKSLKERIPRMDILIDDGGHRMKQQIHTYEELFPHIDGNGVYLCEDLHTSYWPAWGGGYQKRGTFIEHTKHCIDQLNGWHSARGRQSDVPAFARTVHSLHYYDSVFVIEKRPREEPRRAKTGTATVPNYYAPKSRLKILQERLSQSVRLLTKHFT